MGGEAPSTISNAEILEIHHYEKFLKIDMPSRLTSCSSLFTLESMSKKSLRAFLLIGFTPWGVKLFDEAFNVLQGVLS